MCKTCSDDTRKVINDELGFRDEIFKAERELKESDVGVGYDEDWLQMYHRRLNSLISQASDITNPHAVGTAYGDRYEELLDSFRKDLATLQGLESPEEPQEGQEVAAKLGVPVKQKVYGGTGGRLTIDPVWIANHTGQITTADPSLQKIEIAQNDAVEPEDDPEYYDDEGEAYDPEEGEV